MSPQEKHIYIEELRKQTRDLKIKKYVLFLEFIEDHKEMGLTHEQSATMFIDGE